MPTAPDVFALDSAPPERLAFPHPVETMDDDAFARIARLAVAATGASHAAVTMAADGETAAWHGPVLRAGEPIVIEHGIEGSGDGDGAGAIEVPIVAAGGREHARLRISRETPGTWSEAEIGRARDLAELAAAEIAARIAREALRLRDHAVGAARDGIAVVDARAPGAPLVFVNPSFERLTGYAAEDVLGRSCHFLHGPTTDMSAAEAIRDAARRGEATSSELVNYRSDGTPVRMVVSAVPVPDAAGRTAHVVVAQHDVTARRAADEALASREAYFRALFDASADVTLVLDGDGIVRYATPAVQRYLGRTPEEMEGHPALDFTDPAERDALKTRLETLVQNPGPGPGAEMTLVHRDGTRRVFEGQGTNLLHDPAVRGVIVNARDVTERVRAVEQLRDREALVRSVLEGIPDPVFVKDLEGRYVLVNEAACRAMGRPREEVVGLTDLAFFPAAAAAAMRAGDAEVLRAGGSLSIEETIPVPGGRATFLTHKAVRLDAHGNAVGTLGIARDISDRRLAMEELRQQKEILQTVLDSIPLMIGFFDARARFFYVNRHLETMLGRPAAELEGRDLLSDFFDSPAEREAAAEFLVRAEGGWYDARVRVAGGEMADVSWASVRLADGTGIAIGQDVTDRRRAEAALHEREEQLWAAQKMEAIGRLAGGVAHDFNNLLMVVGGHARLLLRRAGEDDDPARWSLEEIRRATERAASLTQQLLAFSRRQVLNPQVLDPCTVVRDACRMLERLVGENVEIVTRLAPETGRIRADATQMEQVLMNLAVNARDAMPDGGVLVVETANAVLGPEHVSQYPYVIPGPHVRIAVTDTGHGMDAETMERAFEPFFTTKPSGKGTGLGLSTVYGIVKQSGGYVWAESRPGVATTFSVYLPRVDAEPPAPAAAPPAPERAPRGSGTVLLVEDEAAVRNLAARVLSTAGYTVLAAASGAEALEQARRAGHVDLVLTDVVMPGMDGTELARRLRAERPGIAVVYMSGYTGDDLERRATLEAGAPFLQKPVPPDALVRGVREALEARGAGS